MSDRTGELERDHSDGLADLYRRHSAWLARRLRRRFGDDGDDIAHEPWRRVLAAYGDGRRDAGTDALGDRLFGAPARDWADAATRLGREAWLYRFDLAPNVRYGACHTIDLPFVFASLVAFGDAPMLRGLDVRTVGGYIDAVQRAWIDFIQGRSPGWPQAPQMRSLP